MDHKKTDLFVRHGPPEYLRSDNEIETGWVTEFIRFPWANPHIIPGNGAEFVAVDREGNIYGGEPVPLPHLNRLTLRKYEATAGSRFSTNRAIILVGGGSRADRACPLKPGHK